MEFLHTCGNMVIIGNKITTSIDTVYMNILPHYHITTDIYPYEREYNMRDSYILHIILFLASLINGIFQKKYGNMVISLFNRQQYTEMNYYQTITISNTVVIT